MMRKPFRPICSPLSSRGPKWKPGRALLAIAFVLAGAGRVLAAEPAAPADLPAGFGAPPVVHDAGAAPAIAAEPAPAVAPEMAPEPAPAFEPAVAVEPAPSAAPPIGSKTAPAAAPPIAAQRPPTPDAANHGEPAADGSTTDADAAGRPAIQSIGDDLKIYVVDHGGKWSMHAENVATNEIVRLWHIAGGPEVTTKFPIDRPYTLSVHEVSTEVILERLFEGFGFTMHYDDTGRLDSVRVYGMRDSVSFKTPRLTETLTRWKEIETDPEAAARKPE
jgi:hypothetical protein